MDFQPMIDFMRRVTDWIVPGAVCAVYRNGERVFFHAEGFSDLENRVPMRGDELFNFYSCSKVTTAVAALQLYERGLFLLDDPLEEYIPAWKNARVKNADGSLRPPCRPVTMRHLFTMTAGLSYDFNTPAFEKARLLTEGRMDTLRTAECLAEDPLLSDPGEHWRYSLCHDVLAAAVEAVSGERFADYVKKHIWEPLAMRDVYYHPGEAEEARMAEQYRDDVSGTADIVKLQGGGFPGHGKIVNVGKKVSHRLGSRYDSGGAGITGAVDDYARFAYALANGGVGLTGERILTPGGISLLRENQLTPAQLADFNWRQLIGYGYGLGVRTTLSRAQSGFIGEKGEFGWGGAAGATVIVDPEANLALFWAEHMLNPHEEFYQPRLRNVLYRCL